MKVKKWATWLGVTTLVVACIFDLLTDGPQVETSQSPGEGPNPIALLQSADHLEKGAQTAPQVTASIGQIARQKAFAYESVVKAMGPTPTMIAATESEVQYKRRQGASDDEIYRFRAAAYSAERATQIAERERTEAAWNIRVQSYLAEKIRLTSSNDIANSGHQSIALQQLRNARFTAEEQKLLATIAPSVGPQLILEADAVSP